MQGFIMLAIIGTITLAIIGTERGTEYFSILLNMNC